MWKSVAIIATVLFCSACGANRRMVPATDQPATHTQESFFGADKVKHFLLSAFAQSVVFAGLESAGTSRSVAFTASSITTAALAIGKEIHDRRTTGIFSVRDLAWDAAGAGAGAIMLNHTQR